MKNLKDDKSKNKVESKEKFIIGIDHIGINVPDIDSATTFLQQAFGAQVIYESHSKEQPPLDLAGIENTLNAAPGTKIYACRMIKIGHGPNIELFEARANNQDDAAKSSDLGIQHFSVYTDHIIESIERFKSAGGKILSDLNPLLFPKEKGDQNFFCYGVMPWGTIIEFITYPDKMPYEDQTALRRWKAGKS